MPEPRAVLYAVPRGGVDVIPESERNGRGAAFFSTFSFFEARFSCAAVH
jgi:hypothetical protein